MELKELTEKQKKEYEDFTVEQFRIIKGHFDRCMARIYNKYFELLTDNISNASVNKLGGKQNGKNCC